MIACVWAPDLALQALLRAEPELRGQAVAVVGESGRVDMLTDEARRAGIARGMKPAQAEAVCPYAAVRVPASEILRAAEAALADLAYGFSPHVEPAGGGWIYFDADGLGRLYDSPNDLERAVHAAAQRIGLVVRVGFGAGKFAARLRARHGSEAPLGELPASALEPSEPSRGILERWGIRTVAELAKLPTEALGRRLGEEGAILSRRARSAMQGASAFVDESLCPAPVPMRFEEAIELDEQSILDLESLAFVVRGVLDRLTARLACRALAADELKVRLALDPRGLHELRVPLRAPTRHVQTLTTLVRLAIAARPPDRAVTGVAIVARAAAPSADQLHLFSIVPPRPEELAATVARVAAIVGPDKVGSPALVDTHRPGAQKLVEFAPPREIDPNISAQANSSIALRWVAPAEEADALRTCAGARVVAHAGPWRVSADWWTEPFDRDYYAVRTADGTIHLVARTGEAWQRVGVFD